MKKSGSKGGERERRKQARVAKTKVKKKKKSRAGKATLAVVPDLPASPDRRVMEGVMAGMLGGPGSGDFDEAQALMYDAWESNNGKKSASRWRATHFRSHPAAPMPTASRLRRLRAIWVSRSSSTARGSRRASGRWGVGPSPRTSAISGGSSRRGPTCARGRDWHKTLWTLGRRDEAVEHYRDLLLLNPDDNQGLRYVLAACLLDLGRDGDTAVLLAQYEEDCAAAWPYAAALLAFRKDGDTPRSWAKLAEGVKANRFVPAYLCGTKNMPEYLPAFVGLGDDNEAVSVAADYASAWRSTPGALNWLRANANETVSVGASSRRSRGHLPGSATE